MPLEAADKTIICSAGQLSPVSRCWSLVRNSLMGFIIMKLVGLHLVPNGMHMDLKWSWETSPWLSLWVYNVDMKPVLISKVLIVQIFCFMHPWYGCYVLHFALLPLCIHGNRCPKGSATSKMNNVKSIDLIIGRYQHWRLVVVFSEGEAGVIYDGIPCYVGSQWSHHRRTLLDVVMTLSHS